MDNHKLRANLKEYAHLFLNLIMGSGFWKIAIYVRLSKEDGNSVSKSILFQIKMLSRFIKTQLDDFEIVDIYIDDGLTGTDFDRHDYIRLHDDVENKEINCIIVKDLTRYARNIADGIKELDSYVLEHKIRFISLDIPAIDTYKDPKAISSPEVYQALQDAENHARNTSVKIRNVQAVKREDGEPTGGFPPYGYLSNPDPLEKNFVIDPEAGEIVKQIFLWSYSGLGATAIAKRLNEMGVPNPTAYKQSKGLKYSNPNAIHNSGKWWSQTISRILKSKVYIGFMEQGKTSSFDHKRHKQEVMPIDKRVLVADCHDKLIDDTMFDSVTEGRKTRTRVTKTGEPHLFSGIICCAGCKGALKKTYNKNKTSYLICRTNSELGNFCEAKVSIRIDRLEADILALIQSQINLVADMQAIVDKINQKPKTKNRSQRLEELYQDTQTKMEGFRKKLTDSWNDWKDGYLSKEQYFIINTDIEKKIEQLKMTQSSVSELHKKIQQGINSNDRYFEKFIQYKNTESLDKLLLNELIKKIYVNPDKSIDVEFKYQDQYLLILDYIRENKVETDNQKIRKKKK